MGFDEDAVADARRMTMLPRTPRVCPECREEDQGNDAHDGECSQLFPYLTPTELATFDKLRPCFAEAFKRESEPEDRPPHATTAPVGSDSAGAVEQGGGERVYAVKCGSCGLIAIHEDDMYECPGCGYEGFPPFRGDDKPNEPLWFIGPVADPAMALAIPRESGERVVLWRRWEGLRWQVLGREQEPLNHPEAFEVATFVRLPEDQTERDDGTD